LYLQEKPSRVPHLERRNKTKEGKEGKDVVLDVLLARHGGEFIEPLKGG
jgi:hypothetical protein